SVHLAVRGPHERLGGIAEIDVDGSCRGRTRAGEFGPRHELVGNDRTAIANGLPRHPGASAGPGRATRARVIGRRVGTHRSARRRQAGGEHRERGEETTNHDHCVNLMSSIVKSQGTPPLDVKLSPTMVFASKTGFGEPHPEGFNWAQLNV